MNPRIKAALIGGLAGGLLSAIVSVVPLVSCCCCLLALGGGILGVFMYTKDTKLPMTPGDGAVFGAITGGFAAATYFVINLALNLIIGTAAMAAQMEQMQKAGVSLPFVGGVLGVAFFSLVGTIGVFILTLLGGVIGSAIFGKGAGTAPPPPPPSGFGGPAGGGYGQGM